MLFVSVFRVVMDERASKLFHVVKIIKVPLRIIIYVLQTFAIDFLLFLLTITISLQPVVIRQ